MSSAANYIILGACNPPNVHKALQVERDIDLMLPYNVIVYELDGKIFILVALPSIAMGMIKKMRLLRKLRNKLK